MPQQPPVEIRLIVDNTTGTIENRESINVALSVRQVWHPNLAVVFHELLPTRKDREICESSARKMEVEDI